LAIVAGIDEAGFGPLLGPLVVSATAFRVPDDQADACLWRLLAGAVGRKVDKRRARPAIADSKKLYSGLRGKDGLTHLELGVLAMLAASGEIPDSLQALLQCVAPRAEALTELYPWYGPDELTLPTTVGATSVALSANALAQQMVDVGVELVDVRCEPVLVGEYNRIVAGTRNKSVSLLDVTCRLLMHLWRTLPDGPLRVYADRQGGRVRYLPHLQRAFEGCAFKVIDESDALSAYRITGSDRSMELHFATKCEDRQLPVALASMTSKYLRELFMCLFNRYWSQHLPELAPTGGYYSDGKRFLAEIEPVVRRMDVDRSLLCRDR